MTDKLHATTNPAPIPTTGAALAFTPRTSSIVFCPNGPTALTITPDGRFVLGPGATWDDAARAILDASERLRGATRELTDGEYASRELIAALRGQLGRARSALRDIEIHTTCDTARAIATQELRALDENDREAA